MQIASKFLATATINGKQVSFFTPPHDEPDFPWVDIQELAGAFLNDEAAARMVRHSQNFGGGARAVATVKNGDRITTIMCHAMAQGLCGMIDHMNGDTADDGDDGPAFREYCLAAGVTAANHWPLGFDGIFKAFKNQGGPFMKGIR